MMTPSLRMSHSREKLHSSDRLNAGAPRTLIGDDGDSDNQSSYILYDGPLDPKSIYTGFVEVIGICFCYIKMIKNDVQN